MMHEEWMLQAVIRLSYVAATIKSGSDVAINAELEKLRMYVVAWEEWAKAATMSERMAILERAEQEVGI